MILRRLYIRYQIWRTEHKIKSISNELNFYWINLATLSVKFYENKVDVEKIYQDFLRSQEDRKRDLLKKLEILKLSLKKL